jgi:hypothetical protein
MSHIEVVWVIVLAGVFGGTVNFERWTKGVTSRLVINLASTVIGTFEGFSFSKLLNPFTPTPFFERTA